MSHVSRSIRRTVVERAGHRCEYCGLSQLGQAAAFHVYHVLPTAKAGPTTSENLALACVACSLYKGDRVRAVDPESGAEVRVFHPRQDDWTENFLWIGERIVGSTPVGRATIELLRMNRPEILFIRIEEASRGRHPPTTAD